MRWRDGPCEVGVGTDYSGPAPRVLKCHAAGSLHPDGMFGVVLCPYHCRVLGRSERYLWEENHCLIKFVIALDEEGTPARCGAGSPGGKMTCSYPPDHLIADIQVYHHLGRDRLGRWRSWSMKGDGDRG